MNAAEFYAKKIPVPSEMLTAQWDGVRLEMRERAFFMAGVAQAEVLQVYHDVTGKFVRGEVSEQDARRALREELTRVGYLPKPGEEDSIKDLRSGRRMNVVLRTNASMANNKAAYDKQLKAIKTYPAKRMVRLSLRREPRDWARKWRALDGIPGVNAPAMAALITSPVWAEQISRFGAPYPPYDFGSGMGDEAVRRDEAQKLGLLSGATPQQPAGGVRVEDGQAVVTPSFNEALQVKPEVTTPAIKEALSRDLTGLAEWKGDTLIFTDPNGTRPVASKDLARTIATENKADIPLLQAETLRSWAEEGPAKMSPGSDALYHFRRLVRRVIPLQGDPALTMTQTFATEEDQDRVMNLLQEGMRWTPRATPFPFSAFAKETTEPTAAEAKGMQVTLRVLRHKSAKDITPAVETLADEDAHGHHVLFERGASFRVLSVERGPDGGAIITMEEDEP